MQYYDLIVTYGDRSLGRFDDVDFAYEADERTLYIYEEDVTTVLNMDKLVGFSQRRR